MKTALEAPPVRKTLSGPRPEEADLLVQEWSRQLSEHALFLSLGLVAAPELAREAQKNRDAWETFRAKGTSGADQRPAAITLATELASIKGRVLDRLEKGEWLGWLFPTFVRHMLQELLWFTQSLESAVTGSPRDAKGDICSWLGFMAEHAAFAAHLLDPVEVRLVREARTMVGALSALRDVCGGALSSLVGLSDRAGRQLDQYLVSSGIGTPKVRSVIHPVLAAHVVREGRMFLEVLGRLRTPA